MLHKPIDTRVLSRIITRRDNIFSRYVKCSVTFTEKLLLLVIEERQKRCGKKKEGMSKLIYYLPCADCFQSSNFFVMLAYPATQHRRKCTIGIVGEKDSLSLYSIYRYQMLERGPKMSKEKMSKPEIKDFFSSFEIFGGTSLSTFSGFDLFSYHCMYCYSVRPT